ncbi:MAG: 50S ribosomal protein L22 [Acidimicrobiia bacterium]|nr:50S ribosomal protein L22 [Acidimicrobiia bacterium]
MAATATGARPGTRAKVRFVRMSASKVRVVLNLIRGKRVTEAIEILEFSERLAAKEILKCLRSAVANAEHNEEIPVEELFISACFADQGPTLRRFRPRARGRAGRIQKQTCHITIEVSRLTAEELDEIRERGELKAAGKASSKKSSGGDRAARVAKSRAAQEADTADADETTDDDVEDVAAETDESAEVATDEADADTDAVIDDTEDVDANANADADAEEAEASDGADDTEDADGAGEEE